MARLPNTNNYNGGHGHGFAWGSTQYDAIEISGYNSQTVHPGWSPYSGSAITPGGSGLAYSPSSNNVSGTIGKVFDTKDPSFYEENRGNSVPVESKTFSFTAEGYDEPYDPPDENEEPDPEAEEWEPPSRSVGNYTITIIKDWTEDAQAMKEKVQADAAAAVLALKVAKEESQPTEGSIGSGADPSTVEGDYSFLYDVYL